MPKVASYLIHCFVMLQGNFDLKGTKYMQGLLDLLELDANKNVRIQVAMIVTV